MSTALKNKKIRVMPITRNGGWLKPGHDGEFMYTGTQATFCVPINADNGRVVDPIKDLSKEERESLAKELSLSVDDLNVYNNMKDNYWLGKYVKLDKSSSLLDLSNPHDLVNYFILKSNSETVAPSFEERLNKGTYRFALVDEEAQVVEKRKSTDNKKEAYKHLGKLESSDTKLRDFFKVYGKKVPADVTRDWMVTEVDKIIDNDVKGFLAVVGDYHYEDKILVSDAVNSRALIKNSNNTYELPGGQILGTIDKTIEFLLDPKNSQILLTVKGRIENNK